MSRTATVFLLCLSGAALASAQVPGGADFQVNSSTSGEHYGARATVDAAGNMTVVWMHLRDDRTHLIGQRFNPLGERLGPEFQVSNDHPYIDWNGYPNLASAADGGFLVTWVGGNLQQHYGYGRARAFSAAGTPLGPAREAGGVVARLPGNQYAVTYTRSMSWPSFDDVFTRRLDATGFPRGAELQVNTYTTSNQNGADISTDALGNSVVVWQSAGQDGSAQGVYAQRFNSSGAAVGGEFQVNSHTTAYQGSPAIAAAPDGRFVVVWESDFQDGSSAGIFARRFTSNGVPLGPEFRVNTYTSSGQFGPEVATDAAGNFVVAWSSFLQDGSTDGVFAQQFDASGQARGAEFRVSTATEGAQVLSDVVSDAHGNVTVFWSAGDQDGHGFRVFARQFGSLQPAALAVDPSGNGVLETGEQAIVAPAWRNLGGPAPATGTALSFTGPPPGIYVTLTPSANYGTIPNGATRACLDCYRVAVAGSTAPSLHRDAEFWERLTWDGQEREKRWRVHLGASFTDVAVDSPFYRPIETLLHHSITSGCAARAYCPASPVSRQEMAVLVVLAKETAGYQPEGCLFPTFLDMAYPNPFCPFVEELARRGVVGGCGGGYYCPTASVSREQMPVFVLRTLDPALDPPACTTPMFADVPASSPYCRWIEELARRGVTAGCGGGNYCPADPVTREQMAVFIAGAFGLTLYGP